MGTMQSRTRFIQAVILAICNVFIIVISGYEMNARVGASDFAQFYIASKRLRAGESVYEPFDPRSAISSVPTSRNEVSELVRTANPPPLILTLWPLAFLSYSAAWWCGCVGTLLLILAMSYRVARELFHSPGERALWVAVGLGSCPTLVNGLLNHVEPWVWALMVWGWLRLRKGEERGAGVFFGLAGCLKLFPLAIIPMLFAARHRKASVYACATAVVGFTLSVAVLGSDSALAFLYEVLPQSARYRFSLANVSGLSLLERIMSTGAARSLGGMFLLSTIYVCRRHRSADSVFVLGVTSALLCSPLTWTYYLILALPCVMVATTWPRGDSPRERALMPFFLLTLVYWPGMLGGWLDLGRLPLSLVLAMNYVPTIGLLVLWRAAQRERS